MVELKNSGVEVIAVCRPGSKIYQFLSTRDLRCVFLPSYRKIDRSSIKLIRSLADECDARVFHVHFHRDIWLASLALRGDHQRKLYLSIYMGVGRKKDIFHRWIYSRVDGLFTSSQELNSRLPDLYPVAKEKIHYLPYGRRVADYAVDPEKRGMIRARHGISNEQIVVGTMVRLDPGKGVIDFAKSMEALNSEDRAHCRYIIVGEPTRKGSHKPGESPYEEHCERYYQEILAYIRKQGLVDKFVFVGFQEDTIGYLSAMDIFVFPSKDELYSLVVLDAMCLRLPIVAARAGGNLHQITDSVSGLFYEVSNSGDLARKIATYLHSPDLRRAHGNAARRFVEKEHSMKEIINRLMLFYA